MTGALTKLFRKYLKQAIKEGCDHEHINQLAGCTDRKIVLTVAEGEAGKRLYQQFMAEHLWNATDEQMWIFGSPVTNLGIGLVPSKLAQQRLRLNSHCWANYGQIV